MARFYSNGAAELYFDNTKRFETTSTGAQVTGNLNVTGVLTYDDVTNIDSLGIVTARTGVDVNAGGINVDGGGLNITGVSTFASNIDANGDLDVDGHTNLDNVSVAGVSTFSDNVRLIDGKKLQIGNSQDLQLHHTGGHSYIANSTGEISILNTNGTVHIRGVGNEAGIEVTNNETVKLYLSLIHI